MRMTATCSCDTFVKPKSRETSNQDRRMRALEANRLVGLFVTDTHGNILSTNMTAKDLLVFEPHSEHRSFLAGVASEDTDRVRVEWAKAIEGARRFCSEFRWTSPDGRKVWLEAFASPTESPITAATEYVGVVRDITGRKATRKRNQYLTDQVRQLNTAFEQILSDVPCMVWESMGSGCLWDQRIKFVNAYVEAMVGYSPSECLAMGDLWGTIVLEEDQSVAEEALHRTLETGNSATFAVRCRSKSGETLWIETHATLMTNAEGHAVGLRGVSVDVTQRKLADESIAEQQRLLHSIYESSSALMGVAELKNGRLHRAWGNRAARDILRIAPFDSDGEPSPLVIGDPTSLSRFEENCAECLRTGASLSYESLAVTEQGQRWLLVTLTPLADTGSSATRISVIADDITERKTREAEVRLSLIEASQARVQLTMANTELDTLARTDGLTGLWNHRHFRERLKAEVRISRKRRHPLSVILLDVDHFKRYNDSFGHLEGDVALVRIAATLRNCVRSVDVVARYGGEEFAIILPKTDYEGALTLAERVRVEVERVPWAKRTLTVSIGVGSLCREAPAAADLVAAADESLYISKRRGRNRVTGARRRRPQAAGA